MNIYEASQGNLLSPVRAAAAIDEMRFWVRIMGEHAKFIRGGVDPTEERIFRIADGFAVEFDNLLVGVQSLVPANLGSVAALMNESIRKTLALRNFKVQLFQALSNCQVTAELPPPLLDHIRREADFFLSNLYRILGMPAVPREVLGIPDGEMTANVVPRLLIPYSGPNILDVARDENLFHLRIQKEHGEVLLLIAYRPKIQDMMFRETAAFENRIEMLLRQAENLPRSPGAILNFNRKVREAMVKWHGFLTGLFRDVKECDVPSGQINAPALILDHMAREVTYYLSVLDLVDQTLART